MKSQPPTASISGLKTVIRTKDFEASCNFYGKLLGLSVIESWSSESDAGCIFSLAENTSVEISRINPEDDYFHDYFDEDASLKIDLQIPTIALDEWAVYLQDHWPCRGPVARPWGSRYLYLKDPDGVQVIFYSEPKTDSL